MFILWHDQVFHSAVDSHVIRYILESTCLVLTPVQIGTVFMQVILYYSKTCGTVSVVP